MPGTAAGQHSRADSKEESGKREGWTGEQGLDPTSCESPVKHLDFIFHQQRRTQESFLEAGEKCSRQKKPLKAFLGKVIE